MGGGVAGWLTPGWMSYDKSLSPHIATPGKFFFAWQGLAYVKEMLKNGENPKD